MTHSSYITTGTHFQNNMSFVPQALADPVSRSVLFVWYDEENFRRFWADKVKTIDAPGLLTHPRLVKVGDMVDLFVTGWNCATVNGIKFTPNSDDIPSYFRSGTYTFETTSGFLSIRVRGQTVIDGPLYVFATKDTFCHEC